MSKLVSNLIDDVAGLLQATDLDNVTNLNGALERAASVVMSRASVPEASGRESCMVYDGVLNYLAPETIFGGSLLDFRPQGNSRSPIDYVYRKPIELFDRTKCFIPNGVNITFEQKNGEGIMRVESARSTPKVLLDPMNSITGWTAGGSASTPVVDATVFYQSNGSLRFTLTGASSGYLEKTFSTPINLPTYRGVGVVFLAIDVPIDLLSSIELRIGSSSGNYNALTVTEGFLGAWAINDFTTLVAFDLSQATTVGAPDWTKIAYVRLTCATTGTITNMRFGNLFISLPSAYEIIFQSSAIFLPSGETSPLMTITALTDTIILNPEAYLIYEYECADTIAFQNGGSFSGGVIGTISTILHGARAKNGTVIQLGLYDLYRSNNPSEKIETIGSWYD